MKKFYVGTAITAYQTYTVEAESGAQAERKLDEALSAMLDFDEADRIFGSMVPDGFGSDERVVNVKQAIG